jgi:2,4-dienoyl-CoA reductase-like NADH-dependent reductase (Old Yellow Enzyme family)
MNSYALDNTLKFSKANIHAKNRIVLAPMTHNMSSNNGDLSNEEIKWLNNCAEGGFGTLITAATLVQDGGRCWQGQPSLMNDYQQDQFTQISKTAIKNNSLAIVQLHHGGVRSDSKLNTSRPVGPSEIAPNERYPQGVSELTNEGIERLISSFATSAKRVYDAGLHGIELHAAHNFLLCSFLNPTLNQRSDRWGGSIENRSRIIVEVIDKIRNTIPREFLIGVRLSPESYANIIGIECEHQIKVANILADNDIDYIHFSMNDTFKAPNLDLSPDRIRVISPLKQVTLLTLIKSQLNTQIPLLVAGKVTDIECADKAIDLGADLVAVGTAALGNPDWVNSYHLDKKILRTPFSKAVLIKSGFNKVGLHYLENIDGLVAND